MTVTERWIAYRHFLYEHPELWDKSDDEIVNVMKRAGLFSLKTYNADTKIRRHVDWVRQKVKEENWKPGVTMETWEQKLEKRYPWISWRDPLPIASPHGSGLACRFCIAKDGLKAEDTPSLPQNLNEFRQHLRQHTPPAKQ